MSTTNLSLTIDRLLTGLYTPEWDCAMVEELVELGDVRVGWLLADLMRFYQTGPAYDQLVFSFAELG